MIGVIADTSDHDVVHEFFELFKTPWEFVRKDRSYEVLLCCGAECGDTPARLVIQYSANPRVADEQRCQAGWSVVLFAGQRLPIYGAINAFPEHKHSLLTDEKNGQSVAYLDASAKSVVARIGYDLFSEIRTLLTAGQPLENAAIPALELHIALLREVIVGNGIRLVEVPPVPVGYRSITCLSHDVDHPSLRHHKLDRTTFGFLHRAVIGSLKQFLRGRSDFRTLRTNWMAAMKLPFVHLGIARDFWRDFPDRYLEIEKDVCSTFFVIPFKNRPGRRPEGEAPGYRAARYGAADIADIMQKLTKAGDEVGLHGIDAWLDSTQGREELEEIRRLTGRQQIGVRMHWLYSGQRSPAVLEEADAAYDSTSGYNQAVGYRAGTTQVYKPLCATRLLELPLHAMDTALFYKEYLALTAAEAAPMLGRLADNAEQFGGCLTVNWHDRSVAPERNWGTCYRQLVQDLKSRGTWFSTAAQAVSWFRKRRAVVFETDQPGSEGVRAQGTAESTETLPGLRLRIHNPESFGIERPGEGYVDIPFEGSIDTRTIFAMSS